MIKVNDVMERVAELYGKYHGINPFPSTVVLSVVKALVEEINKVCKEKEIVMIDEETKKILFTILRSHSKLAQAEYKRNPAYNNTHFSHIAEEKAIELLTKQDLLEEFLKKDFNE